MAKIIIAEDDDSIRALLEAALTRDGHEVTAVEDGSLAAELIDESQAGFDLLLSDIKMPVMDGIALALHVARSWPELQILLMTGFANQRERAYGLDNLVYDVINKPFSINDLREKIDDALNHVPVEIQSLAQQYQ